LHSIDGYEHSHPTIDIGVAILINRDRVWIQRRTATSHLDGYWEFPGGKVKKGETPAEAVRREVLEETNWRIESKLVQHIRTDRYEYPDRSLRLHFFLCRLLQDPGQIPRGRWIDPREIQRFRMPPANENVIQWLLKYAESLHKSDA